MEKINMLNKIALIVLLAPIFSLTSCEKEKYGNMLFEADDEIDYLYWSESSDKIYYGYYGASNYLTSYSGLLYAIDVNTGDSWKIAYIKTSPGNPIYEKDDKIYYFEDTEFNYMNVKLYSVNISGSSPVLVLDSLENPFFSKKYIACMRSYYLQDTSYFKAVLYDLDEKTERIIESDRNEMPASISPDGSVILLRSWDLNFNYSFLLYNTQTGQRTELSISAYSNLYGFFWVDNEVYAYNGLNSGFEIINMVTRQKLNFPEALSYNNTYILSPSGSMLAYLTVEYPVMASGLVGNHYFLNILKAGEKNKRIIDLERDYISEITIAFSPDNTRIAYVRNSDEIYMLNL
jgi:hypothetical protein